jgi:uncharacterized protein YcbX
MIRISALFIYPVKSCRGIEVGTARFDELGPVNDRRWMVVDENGEFLTQRTHPMLAKITPEVHDEGLRLHASGRPSLYVPQRQEGRIAVRVWNFSGSGLDQGDHAARWLSDLLDVPCRLAQVDANTQRPVKLKGQTTGKLVGFADGFPALLLGESSILDLSRRAGTALSVRRFRPNIVVSGSPPYAEDEWRSFAAGSLHFDVVKPCERCVITTLDPDTLEQGKEPLRTLATYRKTPDGVIFGQNCIHRGPGSIRVGDLVSVEPS